MYDICAFGDALIDMFHGDGENTFLANCGVEYDCVCNQIRIKNNIYF